MGTYATTTSLSTIMVGTSFDTATTSLATECIGWAEDEVDKYLSKRYDLSSSTFQTSTSIPPMVTTLSKWLSVGYMYQEMSRGGKEAMARGQTYIDRAINNLKLIADYKSDLLDSSGDPLSDMSNTAYRVLSNTSDYSNTFNEDDPLSWVIDEDKLDDIETERE